MPINEVSVSKPHLSPLLSNYRSINSTRLSRNAGEKKRRDKLNNYISELSAMVPSCRMPQSQRKLDKSTILKLTVSYMKLHADLLPESVDESAMNWKPSFLSNEELGQLMLEVHLFCSCPCQLSHTSFIFIWQWKIDDMFNFFNPCYYVNPFY